MNKKAEKVPAYLLVFTQKQTHFQEYSLFDQNSMYSNFMQGQG